VVIIGETLLLLLLLLLLFLPLLQRIKAIKNEPSTIRSNGL